MTLFVYLTLASVRLHRLLLRTADSFCTYTRGTIPSGVDQQLPVPEPPSCSHPSSRRNGSILHQFTNPTSNHAPVSRVPGSPFPRIVRRHRSSKVFHSAKASLTTLDGKASLTTRQTDSFIGDPGEGHITFDKDVGATMVAALGRQAHPESVTIPLKFFRDSRYFANSMAPDLFAS